MGKLQHKGTGEIISSKELLTDKFIIDLFSKDFKYLYSEVEKIRKVWEVYKEPKRYWYIYAGHVFNEECCNDAMENMFKATGNYFKTKEEAKKAVEKLKAWKRLKDKGFRFERWLLGDEYGNTITFSDNIEYNDETRADLNLLFGGDDE